MQDRNPIPANAKEDAPDARGTNSRHPYEPARPGPDAGPFLHGYGRNLPGKRSFRPGFFETDNHN